MKNRLKNLNTLQKFFLQMFVILFVVVAIISYGVKTYYETKLQKNIDLVLNKGENLIIEKLETLEKKHDLSEVKKIVKTFITEHHFEALVAQDINDKTIINEPPKNVSKFISDIFIKHNLSNFEKSVSKIIPDLQSDKVYLLYITRRINAKIKILIQLGEDQVKLMEDEAAEYIGVIVISALIIIFFSSIIVYRQFKEVIEKNKQLRYANISILNVLGNAVSKRDSDTDEHNYRVTYYSVKIAELLKLDDESIRDLIKGAFLHDVGKIGIEDKILLKPGKLSDDEFEIMKTHVDLGVDIVGDVKWLETSIKVIAYHHEKFDGSGYPKGLKGEDIPIEARIFAIVDVFDALTSKRPYKEPFSAEKSLEIIKDGSNNHFDSQITKVFINNIEQFYDKVNSKSKSELETMLHDIVDQYFSND